MKPGVRSSGAADTMGHTVREIELEVPVPLSVGESAECGQAFRWTRRGDYHYCVLGGNILRLRQGGEKLFASMFPDTGYHSIVSTVRETFRLDDDFEAIIEEISRDKFIREAVSNHRGLRLLRQDPWECLVSYMCSINSNIPRIKGDVERISRRYGKCIEFDGMSFYTFPSVDALAQAGEEELRSMKLGFRSRFISAAARRIRDERVDLKSLRVADYEDAFSELCSYFGIGPKVADCILLFSLDKLEAFPVDRWVRRGVELLYFGGQKTTEKKVSEWSREYFGRYAGYAQEFLFYGSRLREIVSGFTTRNASAGAGRSVLPSENQGS